MIKCGIEIDQAWRSAGGSFTKFSTQKTALSQTHLDGSRVKKSLSQRTHRDNSGIVMHRDLFSAFLARYVNDDLLESNKEYLKLEYSRLETALLAGFQRYEEKSASGQPEKAKPRKSSSNSAEQIAANLDKLEQV